MRPYDPIQAGYDAHAAGEQRRRGAVRRQLALVDWMKWYSGLPSEGAVYYRPQASFDEVYAYGLAPPRTYAAPPIFEPWPYVPGDIWGFRYYAPVRQPIGQRQVQTGPNRWESHPVYADSTLVNPARRAPIAPPATAREF